MEGVDRAKPVILREALKEEVCRGSVLPQLFSQLVGVKVTPSGEYFLNCRFRLARSAERDGLVSASSIAIFCVRCEQW